MKTKDIRDAFHGDGPLALSALRRRSVDALVVVLEHLLAWGAALWYEVVQVAKRVGKGAGLVGIGLWWLIKFFFGSIVWGACGFSIAFCIYNWGVMTFILRGFPAGLPEYRFYSPAIGWPMLIFEVLAGLYFLGRATSK